MNSQQSIEQIWTTGFLNKPIPLPTVNALYTRKSIGIVNEIYTKFKQAIWFQLPIGAFVFLFNLWLDNDNALIWSFISMVPFILYFWLGVRNLQRVKGIDYGGSCYDYLTEIQEEIYRIAHYNLRFTLIVLALILIPMISYTVVHQSGKSFGEVFGIDHFELPIYYLFLFVPILLSIAYIILKAQIRKLKTAKIARLINELKTLKDEEETNIL